MQEHDGASGTGGGNRDIATYDGDGGMGTGSSDDGGSGTQQWWRLVGWQWQTGDSVQLHNFGHN